MRSSISRGRRACRPRPRTGWPASSPIGTCSSAPTTASSGPGYRCGCCPGRPPSRRPCTSAPRSSSTTCARRPGRRCSSGCSTTWRSPTSNANRASGRSAPSPPPPGCPYTPPRWGRRCWRSRRRRSCEWCSARRCRLSRRPPSRLLSTCTARCSASGCTAWRPAAGSCSRAGVGLPSPSWGRPARRSPRWASRCPTWSRRRWVAWCRHWCWRPAALRGSWPSTRASTPPAAGRRESRAAG